MDPKDILAYFKTYYSTAELASATKPEMFLKTKLDSQGHQDDKEINQLVKVLIGPNQAKFCKVFLNPLQAVQSLR